MARRRSIARARRCVSSPAACAWPSPERQLLLDFFQACRVYDTTVLARLATVTFNPRTDGIVQDFDIVSVEDVGDGSAAARDVTTRRPGAAA